MSKICPNCGVNLPDNAKFCIECGADLKDTPISKEKTTLTSKNNINLKQRPIIFIAIIAIAIIAAGFFISGFGGNNISITFDSAYVEVNNYTSGMEYTYAVSGYINNFPNYDDADNYIIKTVLYDTNGKEFTSTTKKLSSFDKFSDKSSPFLYEITENYVEVDHVSVQIIKDNNVLNEFNSTITKK